MNEDHKYFLVALIALCVGLFYGYIGARLLWFYDPADQPIKTVTDTVYGGARDKIKTYVCTEQYASICSESDCIHPTTTIQLLDGYTAENQTPELLGLKDCTEIQ
jgi:prepilin signal peptidase PulO-like enzyme (type II secretory pathway)